MKRNHLLTIAVCIASFMLGSLSGTATAVQDSASPLTFGELEKDEIYVAGCYYLVVNYDNYPTLAITPLIHPKTKKPHCE